MPTSHLSDRQTINGLFGLTILSLVCIIGLFCYEIGRWRDFDELVRANAENIKGVQEAILQLGVKPASVPPPIPVVAPGPPRVLKAQKKPSRP